VTPLCGASPAEVQYRLRTGDTQWVWIVEHEQVAETKSLLLQTGLYGMVAKGNRSVRSSDHLSGSKVRPTRPRLPPRDPPEEPDIETRERILRTAYELFTREGFTAVGVDRIVAEAGVAKTSLYRYFRSKDDLVVAVLKRHHVLWTVALLEGESARRARNPEDRPAALVDVIQEWLRDDGYGGCLFINSVLEVHDRSPAIRTAALEALEEVYELLRGLCEEARLSETRSLAHQLQVLLRGSIVAAREGNFEAVDEARALALQLIEQHR
jgi:AcrR family transcriptional regulator